jgi:opacity protein-like surface antigen
MHRVVAITVLVFCSSLLVAPARAQSTLEIFGGYSYVRQSLTFNETTLCPGPVCPTQTGSAHPNLNGWEISATYNAYKWLGVTADFGGGYGSVDGASTHLNTYLFGPQVRFPGPVSPFAHVLFGAAHDNVGSGGAGSGFVIDPSSSTAFALAVGAGIDIKVVSLVSVRPIQIDYLVTRFGSSTQNQPRVSAGLVLHF